MTVIHKSLWNIWIIFDTKHVSDLMIYFIFDGSFMGNLNLSILITYIGNRKLKKGEVHKLLILFACSFKLDILCFLKISPYVVVFFLLLLKEIIQEYMNTYIYIFLVFYMMIILHASSSTSFVTFYIKTRLCETFIYVTESFNMIIF